MKAITIELVGEASIKENKVVVDYTELKELVNNHENLERAAWLGHEHMKLHLPHYKAGFSVFDEIEEAIKQAEKE